VLTAVVTRGLALEVRFVAAEDEGGELMSFEESQDFCRTCRGFWERGKDLVVSLAQQPHLFVELRPHLLVGFDPVLQIERHQSHR